MGILDSKYDVNIHFSDLVEVISHTWNPTFFELQKLSPVQLESHMVDGTFENVWPEFLATYYEEVYTRDENMAQILFWAISPFLKHDLNTKRPRHIYIPSIVMSGWRGNTEAYSFTIWDDYQREYVFEMKFLLKKD